MILRCLIVTRADEYEILRFNDGRFTWENDLVVEERRVEIFVNGQPYVSVMATPDQLEYLAAGYLFTEGAVSRVSDITNISVNGLNIHVQVHGRTPVAPARARSSGFGLGSVRLQDTQIENINIIKAVPPPIRAELIVEMMEEFNQLSELFWKTGAVHSAWLVSGEQKYFSEDVGRHNALDKVIGQYLSNVAAPSNQTGLIFTTGRISTEMLLKAAKAGMCALISRGSASRPAVELAEKLNIILVGFSRGDHFTAFHGGHYISTPDNNGEPND
ncbi:formate dehydrogenase accessory sulfurtransferase FdhD [Deltaproteobacteria bacterium Smac51]|nr:formate dehydrogenase accessory sulfurtransferase FdhD [Deltaproteobacteria bacterium Smac51]